MWDEAKIDRLTELLLAKENGSLSSANSVELRRLVDERLCFEADSLRAVTEAMRSENEQTRTRILDIQAENRELEVVIANAERRLSALRSAERSESSSL